MKRKILLVDDDPKIQTLVGQVLDVAGYTVVETNNGQNALDMISSEIPHLIISDINMPIMDGWELCWNLKRNNEFKNIPLIFLTDRSEVPDRIRGLESGADDFIPKPFDADELLARVKGVLRRVYGEELPPLDINSLPIDMVISKRYQINKMLGRGGMAAVYQALDLELNIIIAIKFLKMELVENPVLLARFKREIILARKITHPNVVRIFDLGEFRGTRYITMEYITGKSLKYLIEKNGTMGIQRTLEIILEISSALNAIHQLGIIHRDLKPQNILINENGVVKVLDFGIARSDDSTELTNPGDLMGSPAYISPEQVTNTKVDTRCDLYSLGVIMYEMLSGKKPFITDTMNSGSSLILAMKHITEECPPLKDINPDIPQNLSDIVEKLMEKDPELRYQTTAEFIDAIKSVI